MVATTGGLHEDIRTCPRCGNDSLRITVIPDNAVAFGGHHLIECGVCGVRRYVPSESWRGDDVEVADFVLER